MVKKYLTLLTLTLSASAIFSTQASLISAATPAYNWNYLSYELGIGTGFIHTRPFPQQGGSIKEELSAIVPSGLGGTNALNNVSTVGAEKTYSFPVGDVRLGIEKSWHFAKRWTTTLDLALFTPAVTLGYLVSPATRVFIGAHYPIFLNYLLNSANEKVLPVMGVNPFLRVSPRFGVDHFVSPDMLIRVALSLDTQLLYNAKNESNASLYWPQLTIGIKKFF